jgi:hypothetical protein
LRFDRRKRNGTKCHDDNNDTFSGEHHYNTILRVKKDFFFNYSQGLFLLLMSIEMKDSCMSNETNRIRIPRVPRDKIRIPSVPRDKFVIDPIFTNLTLSLQVSIYCP